MTGIQLKSDGVYVDEVLKLPFDKTPIAEEAIQKIIEGYGVKTINGESLLGSGNITVDNKVLQVVTLETPNERYYFNTNKAVEIPGLSVDLTPLSDNSIIIIHSIVYMTMNYVRGVGIKVNDIPLGAPTNHNPLPDVSGIVYDGRSSNSYLAGISIMEFYKNTDKTTKRISTIVNASWDGRKRNYYVNDRSDNDMRSLSKTLIMEVKI